MCAGRSRAPASSFNATAGNTSCLEVDCGEGKLIFDAGTGLRFLGDKLTALGTVDSGVFLTHTHIDHINGLPFFGPLYGAENRIRFWAGHLLPDHDPARRAGQVHVGAALSGATADLRGQRQLPRLSAPARRSSPARAWTMRSAPLNHPNNATGYRVDYDGRSICYITDTEHVEGVPDQQTSSAW